MRLMAGRTVDRPCPLPLACLQLLKTLQKQLTQSQAAKELDNARERVQ